jgi:hypothetical protein
MDLVLVMRRSKIVAEKKQRKKFVRNYRNEQYKITTTTKIAANSVNKFIIQRTIAYLERSK